MACNKNPLLLIVPCHRVVGKFTGFAYGMNAKQHLQKLKMVINVSDHVIISDRKSVV